MNIRFQFLVVATVLGLSTGAVAQVTNQVPVDTSPTNAQPWSFSAAAYGYIVPESRDYVNPNIYADHGWLHLEARYNYEALDTGSLWVGYNFSAGEKLTFGITPMIGGVFGDLNGVAPGWNLSLGYKWLALSSSSEYVFATGDSSRNFFYTWSELSASPFDWLRLGLVVQRTKAYQTELDIQRGFLVGLSHKKISLTSYVFNVGWTKPTYVLALGYNL